MGPKFIQDGFVVTGGIATGVGLIALRILISKLVAHFRKTRAYHMAWRERSRQSDWEFLKECGFEDQSEAGKLALAVRRAMGEVAEVPAETIHADDWMRDR